MPANGDDFNVQTQWLRFFCYKTAYAAASPAPSRHRGFTGLRCCNRAKSAYSSYFKKVVPIETLILPAGECLCSFLNALKALISIEN